MHILTTVKNLFRLKTDDSTNDGAQPPPYDGLKFKRDERSDAESTKTKPAFKLPEPRTMAYYGLTDNDFRRPVHLHAEAPSTNQKVAGPPIQSFNGNQIFHGKVTNVNIRRDPGDPANCDEANFSMEDSSESSKAA